jgi:hypothetical protein
MSSLPELETECGEGTPARRQLAEEPLLTLPTGVAPLASLKDLRARHSTLLQRRTSGSVVTPADILDFLSAASQTGANIPEEDMDARESAQGILDYWTATLLSQNPAVANIAHSVFTLAPFDAARGQALSGTSFDLQENARQTAIKADAISAQAYPAELKALSALLLRLVHLKESSLEPFTQRVPEKDVLSPELKEVKGKLLKAGILIRREDGGTPATLSLQHDLLLTEWKHLAGLIKKRRAFRELASGWRRGDEPRSALLERGEEMEEAKSYRDLNPVESDFLEKSRAREKTAWRTRMIVAGGMIFVLLGLLGWLVFKHFKLNEITQILASSYGRERQLTDALTAEKDALIDEREKLKKQIEVNDQQNKELEKKQAELVRQALDLDGANKKLAAEKEEALVKLKLLTTSLEDAAKYKGKADLLQQQITQVANSIAEGKGFPPQAREILTTYRTGVQDDTKKATEDTTHAPLAQSLANFDPSTQQALQPGNGISTRSKTGESRGSLGVFVRDAANNLYIVSPAYILSGSVGAPVFAGREQKAAEIGNVSGMTSLDASDLTNLALVKLKAGVPASNIVDGVGEIQGVEPSPAVGMEVVLVGSGSGISEGKIREVRADGTIVTAGRISKPGDEGAPIIAKGSQKLIGLLISSTTEESTIMPLQPLLARYNLRLYQTAESSKNDFSGVLAEVFVSAENPLNISRAAKYVEALQKAGLRLPVAEAQPRNKVPATVSEVRYFYDDPENRAIAEKVRAQMIQAGLPADKVRVSLTPDATAPQRFIQISLAKAAFPALPPTRR